MKYHVADVVRTTPEYGGRQFVVAGIEGGKYAAVCLKTRRRYFLEEGQIEDKVGHVSPAHPCLADPDYDPVRGSRYAEERASQAKGRERQQWLLLAAAKPGDALDVVHGGYIRSVEFMQVNINKPSLVFRARLEGKAHDFKLGMLSLPALQPE